MALKIGMFSLALIIFQVIFLVLFAVFGEYDYSVNADKENNSDPDGLMQYYPMFQDVHVMLFVGFGFLMTYLKRYGFGAVGLNMVAIAFVLQWFMLFNGLLNLVSGKIRVTIIEILGSDFSADAILISHSALLGKISPIQLLIMAFIEIIVFTINQNVCVRLLQAVDVGVSVFVHVFGTYFGLSVARMLWNKDCVGSSKEVSEYRSDISSMMGTLFLWMFWPSFNAVLSPAGDGQYRAILNTYLALTSCVLITFALSSLVSKDNKLIMIHIQNATLAGGVAVGTSADMVINMWGAVLIGMLAAVVSVVGFTYITPWMSSKLKVHDTCGVHNLHGLPGIMSGICASVTAVMASTADYGYGLYEVFPAMAPAANTTELLEIQAHLPTVVPGEGRSAHVQGLYQFIALVVTFTTAVIFGHLTGLLLKLSIWEQPEGDLVFDDTPWWNVPEDFIQKGEKAGSIHHKLMSSYGAANGNRKQSTAETTSNNLLQLLNESDANGSLSKPDRSQYEKMQ